MSKGLKISIFTWLSLFILNTCQCTNVWNLHPQPWRHFECRTSGDCAIKIHSADRNCNNRGKMSSVYSFHSPVTLSPRNTGEYVVHIPIGLLSYNDKRSQLLLEENRRGEEVFWHICQVRSLEASITLWEWKDAFYITLKSTCTAGQGYVCVWCYPIWRISSMGSKERRMQL